VSFNSLASSSARPATLDQFDFIAPFERLRQTQADIAAASNHDAFDACRHAPQLGQHRMDVLCSGQQEYFIARFDDGIALRKDRLVFPEDGGNTGIDFRWQMFAHFLDRLADQQAALVGADRHQTDPATGEIEHLQAPGETRSAGGCNR
jgi:hypothetical protein